MGQYSVNFGEYPTGVFPGDWTRRWNTTYETVEVREYENYLGGQALYYRESYARERCITWDEIDSYSGTVDLRAKFITGDDNNRPFGLLTDGSGGEGEQDAFAFSIQGVNEVIVTQFIGGTRYTRDTISFDWDTNVWYWIRIRRSGWTLYYKIWRDDEDEPHDWKGDYNVGSNHSGYFGIYRRSSYTTIHLDYYSVGTGGDSSPEPQPAKKETREVESYTLAFLSFVERAIKSKKTSVIFINNIFSQVKRNIATTRKPAAFINKIITGSIRIAAAFREPLSYVRGLFSKSAITKKGQKEIKSYITPLLSGLNIKVKAKVVSYTIKIATEIQAAGTFIRTVVSYTKKITAKVYLKRVKSVAGYLLPVASKANLSVLAFASSFIKSISSSIKRAGTSTRGLASYIKRVFGETKRSGKRRSSVSSYIVLINGHVKRTGKGLRQFKTYTNSLFAAVKRLGHGTRSAAAYLITFVSENFRAGKGLRHLTSYTGNMVSFAASEAIRKIRTSIKIMAAASKRKGYGLRETAGYIGEITADYYLKVKLKAAGFLNPVYTTARRHIKTVVTAVSYISVFMTRVSIIKKARKKAASYLSLIFSGSFRLGQGIRTAQTYTNSVYLLVNLKVKTLLTSFVKPVFAQTQIAAAVKAVASYLKRVFFRAEVEAKVIRKVASYTGPLNSRSFMFVRVIKTVIFKGEFDIKRFFSGVFETEHVLSGEFDLSHKLEGDV